MAIIKCKMCGGDLELIPDSTVCECEYCGTRQTVPAADDEKKLKLFERANRLRRACEFDKAAGVYESIVADFDTEAEAYWGLVLCKFGIEYVDDPATGKKVPTCHRAGFESVEDDVNFEQACENADAVARRVYREEGRAIDELRERIIEVSGREEPYDIFISYKELAEDGERTEDSVLAQDIYDALTAKGYRVFFSRVTLEDKLGVEYEPYIFAALQSAKVMLLVGMDYENLNAVWVRNEWSRYLALMAQYKEKVLIPCYKGMDPYDLPKEVRKLAAQDMGKVGAMQDLLRGVEKIIPGKNAQNVSEAAQIAQAQQPMYVSNETDAKTSAAIKRGQLALEERNWASAKNYFEQALTLNAECAEAYYGIALADHECTNEDEYISKSTPKPSLDDKKAIQADAKHIEECVPRFVVPGFLSEEDLRNHYYQFDLSYMSAVQSAKKLAEEYRKKFLSDRNFTLADRFADGPFQVKFEAFKKRYFDSLEKLVEKAKQDDQQAKDDAESRYAAFLETADKEAELLYKNALESRESTYLKACKTQDTTEHLSDFISARNAFNQLGDYKDSPERKKKCENTIQRMEKEAEEKRTAAKKAQEEALEIRRNEIAQQKAKKKKKKIIIVAAAAIMLAIGLIAVKMISSNALRKEVYELTEQGDYGAVMQTLARSGSKDDIRAIAEETLKYKWIKYNSIVCVWIAQDDIFYVLTDLGLYGFSEGKQYDALLGSYDFSHFESHVHLMVGEDNILRVEYYE